VEENETDIKMKHEIFKNVNIFRKSQNKIEKNNIIFFEVITEIPDRKNNRFYARFMNETVKNKYIEEFENAKQEAQPATQPATQQATQPENQTQVKEIISQSILNINVYNLSGKNIRSYGSGKLSLLNKGDNYFLHFLDNHSYSTYFSLFKVQIQKNGEKMFSFSINDTENDNYKLLIIFDKEENMDEYYKKIEQIDISKSQRSQLSEKGVEFIFKPANQLITNNYVVLKIGGEIKENGITNYNYGKVIETNLSKETAKVGIYDVTKQQNIINTYSINDLEKTDLPFYNKTYHTKTIGGIIVNTAKFKLGDLVYIINDNPKIIGKVSTFDQDNFQYKVIFNFFNNENNKYFLMDQIFDQAQLEKEDLKILKDTKLKIGDFVVLKLKTQKDLPPNLTQYLYGRIDNLTSDIKLVLKIKDNYVMYDIKNIKNLEKTDIPDKGKLNIGDYVVLKDNDQKAYKSFIDNDIVSGCLTDSIYGRISTYNKVKNRYKVISKVLSKNIECFYSEDSLKKKVNQQVKP
jgi:hypothetical protein